VTTDQHVGEPVMATPSPTRRAPRPTVARPRGGWRRIDWLLVTVVSLVAVAAHPIGYLLHTHPYWADEAWVAVLSRAPLSQWPSLSSSTPMGWLFLVRLVRSRDALRIVPLLFIVADGIVAYVFSLRVRWRSAIVARVAALTAALLVSIAPATLIRHDLKQYSADACFALVLVTLGLDLDRRRDRATLIRFAIVASAAVLFSNASAFVTVALVTSWLVVTALSRPRADLKPVLITAGAIATAIGGYALVVIVPHTNKALRAYWNSYYLSGGLKHEIHVVWLRLVQNERLVGMPPLVFIALVTTGCIVLAWRGHRVVALAIPALWAEMFVLGALHRYPFLDARTSHFLIILSLAVAAIGVVGVLAELSRRWRAGAAVSAVALVVLGLAYAHGAKPFWRSRLPNEDVRGQVLYVAAHRRPQEPIVVSLQGTYGFAYYWPGAHRRYAPDTTGRFSNGFAVRLHDAPGIDFATGNTTAEVDTAMQRALTRARAEHARHIWIVRTHLSHTESAAFNAALSASKLQTTLLPVGGEPLLRVDLGPAASP
jgi:hypothetical protein